MKHINKLSLAILFIITFAIGCKKDETMNYFEGGTAPVLSSTLATGSTFILKPEDAAKDLLELSWTNPNYTFTTGTSSQDVSYTIEIDSSGKNFTGNNLTSLLPDPTYSLNKKFTVTSMNDQILKLKFDSSAVRKIDIRIKSNLANNNAILYSNTISYMVKPYPIPPKVMPPSTNELFITGGATPASWMSGGDPPLLSQKFNQLSPTLYELPSIALSAGGEYLIVPRYGNWSAVSPDPEKYGSVKSTGSMTPEGDDFQRFGNNYKAPAIGGNFKITLDFQLGTIKLTRL